MAYIVIEDFKAGLDRRKMLVTSVPGTLYELENAHITRGGEIEKRKAFAEKYQLPAGATVGMAVAKQQLYVFGHQATPAGMPSGVVYQRLEHPDGEAMVRLLSHDVFDGRIYAAAEYADGSIFHFFNGTRVTDWFDGKARASFQVQNSTEQTAIAATGSIDVLGGAGAVAATGSFTVTGGTSSAGVNQVLTVTVNGVDILGAAVDHTGDNSTTATALASQINSFASSPDYTASAVGAVVTITAATAGAGPNGFVVSGTVAGDATLGSYVNMSGGVIPDTFTSITVNGVDILGSTVAHTGNNTTTAAAIASQINSFTSSPNYTATNSGPKINITATAAAGSGANGYLVSGTATGTGSLGSAVSMSGGRYKAEILSIIVNGVDILGAAVPYTTDPEVTAANIAIQINSFVSTPNYTATSDNSTVNVIYETSGTDANGYLVNINATAVNLSDTTATLEGGVESEDTLEPGPFVKTIKTKMYSTSSSLFHYSAVNDPTEWNGGTGSGFINMANQASGSEQLVAIENYYPNVAIFSRRNVQIWYIDVDEAQNSQLQVLRNTGAISSGSVGAFGDNDVFYLAQTGIRSLKARDSSNSAYVSDVGTAIDTLVTEDIRNLDPNLVTYSKHVIDPVDGRYWLALGPTVYVFSFFPSSKISAWSTYVPGFVIEYFATLDNQIFARSGDTIYLYGGDDGDEYDAETEVTVTIPYLDGNKPDNSKQATAVGMACEGEWSVDVATDPRDISIVTNKPVTVEGTTYGIGIIPLNSYSTHFAIKMTHKGEGYARIGNLALHYTEGEVSP